METIMTSTDNTDQQFFDLHTSGIGYLNRYRVVPSDGGDYASVSIAALQGRKSKPKTVYFDTTVSGSEAKDLVAKYEDQINDREAKVLVRFKIDGVTARTFTFNKGKRQGEQGIDLKGRLLRIDWIRIKGQGEDAYTEVYKSERSGSTAIEPSQGEKLDAAASHAA